MLKCGTHIFQPDKLIYYACFCPELLSKVSIFVEEKSVVLHLLEGPEKGHTNEGQKEKKKIPALDGIRTHFLRTFVTQENAATVDDMFKAVDVVGVTHADSVADLA